MFDFDGFLKEALRAGVTVQDFWAMTPHETRMAIEAGVWRMEQEQEMLLLAAWHQAALGRTKKMPPLKSFLKKPARKLKGKELQARRQEHADITKNVDLNLLRSRLDG